MRKGVIIGCILVLSIGYLINEFIIYTEHINATVIISKETPKYKDIFKFLLVGDFGLLEPKLQFPVLPVKVVADSMNEYAKNTSISAIFTVGDNYYYFITSYFSSIVFQVMEFFTGQYIKDLP